MKNIYLISSSSIHLMEDEIKKIVKDNPYTTFDLNACLLDDILEEASYFSLFDEKKYIVVKNANIFGASKKSSGTEEKTNKKDDKLIKYLDEPNSNTILIFTINGKVDSKKKITKTIKERYELIEIADLKPKEIYNTTLQLLKNNGYKIDSNTLYYIINNSLNNYDLTINELEKIKLYYKKACEIKLEDVINIVSKPLEDNEFKFVDAVMAKDIKESYRICDDLMIQKVEPIKLLNKIATQVRNTLLVKKMINTHSKKDMMSTLGINYDFMLDKLINNSYSFKEKELENYLVMICDFDYKIKKGKISNKLALEMIIMQICK